MNTRTATIVVFLFCALVLIPGQTALAQSAGYGTGEGRVPVQSGEAIPVGPFLFSPAVQLTWEARDNLFLTPTNEVSDNVYLARARIMFELPVYESYVRFSYTPQYREFKDFEFEHNWGHFVDVIGAFEFSSGLKLTTAYKFANTALETRLVDPGGELVVGNDPFSRNFLDLVADYWLTQRDGFTIEGSYTDLKYDENQDSLRTFYDYTLATAGVGWLHQLSPTAIMRVVYRYRNFDAESISYRDSTANEVTLGVEGQLTPVLSSGGWIGYRRTEFGTVPGQADFDDFSGVVIGGNLSYQLAHGSSLRLDLDRQDYPSNSVNNAFYDSLGGSLTYQLQRERFTGQARVRLQNNDYSRPDPATGVKRSDDITTFNLGLGYRVNELFSLQGTYLYEKRESLFRYSYTANIFALGLIFGF